MANAMMDPVGGGSVLSGEELGTAADGSTVRTTRQPVGQDPYADTYGWAQDPADGTRTADDILREVLDESGQAGDAEAGQGILDKLKAGMEANEGEYGNVLSSILGAAGGMVGEMLPGTLGEMAKGIFTSLADKIEKIFGPKDEIRQEMTGEIMGMDVSDVAEAGAGIASSDHGRFAADLAEAAAESPGDAARAPRGLSDALREAAAASPAAAGKALEGFDMAGKAWLEANGAQYPDAEENLRAVNRSLATAYYESVMQAEAGGLKLTAEDRKALRGLDMDGVSQTYSQYKAQREADPDYGITAGSVGMESDGSLVGGSGKDYGRAKAEAAALVAGGGLADARTDGAGMESFERQARDRVDLLRDGLVPEDGGTMTSAKGRRLASGYMDIVTEYQAFNDAAMSAIGEKYGGDPEGKAAAEAGLALRMQAGMAPLFDAMKADMGRYGCFSESQLEKLDGLSVSGVTTKFSEYESGEAMFGESMSYGSGDEAYAKAMDVDGIGRTLRPEVGVTLVNKLKDDLSAVRGEAGGPTRDSFKMACDRLNVANIGKKDREAEYGIGRA